MHITSIVSAGALVLALGMAAPAFAQTETAAPTMIGGQQLSEADVQRVQTYCEDLNTKANQAEGSTNDDVDAPATEEAGGSADTAAVGSVDMSLITIGNCVDAGFLKTMM
jgi:hypothetical protein